MRIPSVIVWNNWPTGCPSTGGLVQRQRPDPFRLLALEGQLRGDPVAVARQAVARRTIDAEPLPAALHHFGRDGHGKRRRPACRPPRRAADADCRSWHSRPPCRRPADACRACPRTAGCTAAAGISAENPCPGSGGSAATTSARSGYLAIHSGGNRASAASSTAAALMKPGMSRACRGLAIDLGILRPQGSQQIGRGSFVELRVGRLDGQKKRIGGALAKLRAAEQRMIQLRQIAEHHHAAKRRQRPEQDEQLERDRECSPAG